MNFDLTDDQKMLVETAASFARKESPVTRLRALRQDPLGFSKKVWRQMGELGWLGILFPEDLGGFGGRFIDAALVIEQFGATLVPEPYIPSVVLGGTTILAAGSPEQHKRWLVPLIGGEITLALATTESGSRYDVGAVETRAVRDGDGYRIDGEKAFVLGGHAAEAIVVSARTEAGVSLFVIDRETAGLTVQPVDTMDGHKAAMLRFEGVSVGADRLLGTEGGAVPVLEATMDRAAAAACAEAVGITRTVLDMTVEYLKTREQFGVKIGVFQALQHRAVDMFVEVETCKSMAILAAMRADDPDPDVRAEAVSAAKVQLSRGGRFVTAQGIQLHGGIGCTDEHDVGLYFKRLQVLSMQFGDEEHHVRRFAALPSFVEGVA
ncbi:MAG TPA: acyl-CoA dehydrogenase [Kofleriaceae bacterium]|nr:acyl-CoA dehydrogenase [Kofleriaceae bacterium]